MLWSTNIKATHKQNCTSKEKAAALMHLMDGPLDSCLLSFCKMETQALISFAPAAQVWVFAFRAFNLLAAGDDWLPMIGFVHVWRRWACLAIYGALSLRALTASS